MNTKSTLSKIIGISLLAVVVLGVVLFFNVQKTRANLSRVQEPTSCSTQGTTATVLSTTTRAFIIAGTATTTATCNMTRAGSGTEIFDVASLQILFSGSSTVSTLNIDIQDSVNGVDWYPRSMGWNVATGVASTTPSLGQIQTYTLTFASTTADRSAVTNANSTVAARSILLPTQATFIRAVFTVPIGSANGSVWANFVGKTQVQ